MANIFERGAAGVGNITGYNRAYNQIKKIQSAIVEYQSIKNPDGKGQEIMNSEEQNSFRHAVLNAAITSQVGEGAAIAASEQHEGPMGRIKIIGDDNVHLKQVPGESEAKFKDRIDASVDYQNNAIGRKIGRTVPKNTTVHNLTGIVANEFAVNGLYMPTYNKDENSK